MRLRPRVALWPWLALANLLSLSTAASSSGITLSQFQQISDFSASCTTAYNTPIPGCTAADFVDSNPCSDSCIRGLQTITALLNSNCQGTQANPKTLIGLFFQGQGVKALCPNAGTSGASQSVSTFSAASTSASSSPTSTASSTSASSSTSSTASTVTRTTPSISTTASASSSGPTQTAVASISTSSGRPTTTKAGSGFTKTAINQGSATVLTSKADQTASTNPDAFGGGGSPFEISSGVSHTVVDGLWVLYGTAICMVAIWLI